MEVGFVLEQGVAAGSPINSTTSLGVQEFGDMLDILPGSFGKTWVAAGLRDCLLHAHDALREGVHWR